MAARTSTQSSKTMAGRAVAKGLKSTSGKGSPERKTAGKPAAKRVVASKTTHPSPALSARKPALAARPSPRSVKARAADPRVSSSAATLARQRLAAIDRAFAVIEFAMDGTVLSANQNFLNVAGYSLDEIVGKHHSQFIDASLRTSDEYASFWNRLRGGAFESGQFRRLGKDGRELWLEASYNPVLNDSGKPLRVVKIATDITAAMTQVARYRANLESIARVQDQAGRMAESVGQFLVRDEPPSAAPPQPVAIISGSRVRSLGEVAEVRRVPARRSTLAAPSVRAEATARSAGGSEHWSEF